MPWTTEELERIAAAPELRIAVTTEDGGFGRQTPIWVVRVGDEVAVRSWYRRETGWFGRAVAVPRALIAVPGLEVEVTVDDVGTGDADWRSQVDAAYRDKYGPSGHASMVTDDAAATTLRLVKA